MIRPLRPHGREAALAMIDVLQKARDGGLQPHDVARIVADRTGGRTIDEIQTKNLVGLVPMVRDGIQAALRRSRRPA